MRSAQPSGMQFMQTHCSFLATSQKTILYAMRPYCHHATLHRTSPHHTTPHHTTPHHTTPHHTTLRTTLCNAPHCALHRACTTHAPHHAMLHTAPCTTLRHTPHRSTHHTTPCHTTPHTTPRPAPHLQCWECMYSPIRRLSIEFLRTSCAPTLLTLKRNGPS
jgi:hypothetical protein